MPFVVVFSHKLGKKIFLVNVYHHQYIQIHVSNILATVYPWISKYQCTFISVYPCIQYLCNGISVDQFIHVCEYLIVLHEMDINHLNILQKSSILQLSNMFVVNVNVCLCINVSSVHISVCTSVLNEYVRASLPIVLRRPL